jgi:hypothetical protein
MLVGYYDLVASGEIKYSDIFQGFFPLVQNFFGCLLLFHISFRIIYLVFKNAIGVTGEYRYVCASVWVARTHHNRNSPDC